MNKNTPNILLRRSSFLRVTLRQYGKAFGLPTTPVALPVPGVNTPPYIHRFNSLIYIKILAK